MALKVSKPKATLPIHVGQNPTQSAERGIPNTRTMAPQLPLYLGDPQNAPQQPVQGTPFDQTQPQVGVTSNTLQYLANPDLITHQWLLGMFGGQPVRRTVPKLPNPKAQPLTKLPLIGG